MRVYEQNGRIVHETVNPNLVSAEEVLLAAEDLADKIAREVSKLSSLDFAKSIVNADMEDDIEMARRLVG